MNTKRILFWDSSVSDMQSGRKFGGIAVQLNFWMQVFHDNGWEIHALTETDTYIYESVHFHHIRHIQSVEIALEWINIYRIVRQVHPQLIVFRGARRLLYPLQKIANRFGAKLIMQGASDVNFECGNASVGNSINRRLYEAALSQIDYFVCQNQYQAVSLKKNFGRDSLIIPNIWGRMATKSNSKMPTADVVWVGNFRRLKRPEWFFDAARSLPNLRFAIAGGAADFEYFSRMANEADSISNLKFLGQISIEDSNKLIGNAHILVCSSEYEGFPNTFLQAWSQGVPVISTVDPNNLIETYNLGLTVDNRNALTEAIDRIIADKPLYQIMHDSINSYFSAHHSAQKCYEELLNYIHINE